MNLLVYIFALPHISIYLFLSFFLIFTSSFLFPSVYVFLASLLFLIWNFLYLFQPHTLHIIHAFPSAFLLVFANFIHFLSFLLSCIISFYLPHLSLPLLLHPFLSLPFLLTSFPSPPPFLSHLSITATCVLPCPSLSFIPYQPLCPPSSPHPPQIKPSPPQFPPAGRATHCVQI